MRVNNVIVSKFAKDDLREIVSYYKSLSLKYAERAVSEFEKNVLSLKLFPLSGRVVPELGKQGIDCYRELIQGNYRIIYEICDEVINILAVINGRRNFEDIIISKIMRTYGNY